MNTSDSIPYDESNTFEYEGSDDDFDWEEVAVPAQEQSLDIALEDVQEGPSSATRPNIEITIRAKPKQDDSAKRRAAQIQAERVARLQCHQIHTVMLLANARIRNRWLNDELLHARLLSLTPMALQTAFAMITKSKVPEPAKRGRLFETAITRLAEWWSDTFDIEPTGHIRSRTYEEVQQQILKDTKGKGKAIALEDEDEEGEVIRSEKSFMKHALMKRGTRDTSAQLFTALCRALGIPARLVVSLQSVPWQAGVGKPKPTTKKKGSDKGKGKAPANPVADDDNDDEMEEVSIPGTPGSTGTGASTPAKGKPKVQPIIRLRKSKGGRKPGSAHGKPRKQRPADPTTTPPVFWTEVFSRADGRWIPVDPIRVIVNKRKAFDPTPPPNSNNKPDRNVRVENRMVYVVAFEEDGYARDVTPRYAREYGAKVAKMQQGGKGRKLWWERIMSMVHRPYRLNRDDVEDEELHANQMTEQMPTSMAGFKDHPLYVLARHLKRDEVIHPLTEIGKFRGEPVYPRANVISLKTAENWMRQGRKVKEGCQPMKMVKQRAVTVNKRRAIEMAMADRAGESGLGSEKDIMQGLYAYSQTELYKPDPVVDGKVPKNDFGNIDLYVPSMLPAGAAYIPHKGAAKIARQLGFDYAEAVTSFEFKKQRAIPVITGVVVAAENEEALLEAYWAAEHEADLKRREKRQEQVIKRWKRLIHGLHVRQRLQEQYADRDKGPEKAPDAGNPEEPQPQEHVSSAGGFLTSADDVVQPYALPRNLHEVSASPVVQPASIDQNDEDDRHAGPDTPHNDVLEVIGDSEDEDLQEISIPSRASSGAAPKTMRELAEAMNMESTVEAPVKEEEAVPESAMPTPKLNGSGGRKNGRTTALKNQASSRSTPETSRGKSTPASRRTRKRARDTTPSDLEASGDDNPVRVPSTKRSRARPTPPPVPRSDRVLRSRAPKSTSKIQEELDLEDAYRRAIEE
ncbi:Rad4-domain-containing protein [Panus rudis PR-1116 ss-1]|nr:Rad4-domain-containing protein [Panus rudis PR-1116 ss-1]